MFQIEISLKFTVNHGPVSPSNFFYFLSFLSFLSSQGGIKLGWQNSEQLADIGLLVRTIVRSFTSCGRSFRHHICCLCSDESTLSFIGLVITHLTHPWGPPWALETLGDHWRPLATCLKITILRKIQRQRQSQRQWQIHLEKAFKERCLSILTFEVFDQSDGET